jgi:hypothetical protein
LSSASIAITYPAGFINLELGTSGVTPGTYGSASQVGIFTVNAYGVLTAASNTSIGIDASQIISGTLPVIRGGTGQSTYTDGQLLIGNSTGNTLTKATLTAGTGISVTNGAGSITIANTGVLSVSGTAPVVSSGGATPAISMAAANTTTNGYLTSTDWNTFNNKAPATSGTSILYGNGTGGFSNVTIGSGISFAGGTLSATGSGGTVTSVSGTAPISVATGTTTPVISISQATTSTDGYLSSTDWNTFNNKQPAGAYLTAVTADAPLSGAGTSASHLVISQANTTTDGYLSSTDWNTFNNKQPAGTYVTSISIASSNGFTGTSSGGATPSLTLATSVTGILKGNGTAISAATSGTDYAPATSGTSILYGDGAGGFSNVTIGTGVSFAGGTLSATGTGGTVTSVAALTLGTTGTDLSSTVANGTTTPVITLQVPTASAANRGALSAADWSTFNGKAPAVTYTTNYIPYGQGTTSLNQSAGLQFDGTNFTTTGYATATSFRPSSATVPTNGLYLPAANFIGWATNSTYRGGFDSTGNFLVGTTGVTGSLNGTVINVFGSGVVRNITQSTGQYAVYNIGSGGTSATPTTAGYWLTDSTANTMYITASSNTPFLFGTNNTERMRIHASGGVSIGNTTDPGATNLSVTGTGKFGTTVGVGAATPAASGAGITFPATQSASTDANTLDDYEEGTFTPTIVGSTTAGTASYTAQNGRYTKIGRLVTFEIYLVWSGGTGTGELRVSGLPFTSISGAPFGYAFAPYMLNVTFTANNICTGGYVLSSATSIRFIQTPVGGGATSAVSYDAAGEFMLSGSYTT